MRAARSALLCFVTIAALRGTGQGPSDFKISDNVNLVLLDVSVKDSQGGYTTNLKSGNFQVFDNAQPRTLTHFSNVDTPVTIGLIVDNSGSMRSKRSEVVASGLAFAKESNPQDEFFVVNFNDTVVQGLPRGMRFTDNLQILQAALYHGEPIGQTALYDAVAAGLKHLQFSRHDKRTLIVVSDGGDNVSATKLPDLLRLVESSRATVYTVGLYDPEDRNTHLATLKKMSKISGGEFFQPAATADIPSVFRSIAKNIRNSYTLGYIPNDSNSGGPIHRVKVTARENGRKLVVRTRTTYSMEPLPVTSGQENTAKP